MPARSTRTAHSRKNTVARRRRLQLGLLSALLSVLVIGFLTIRYTGLSLFGRAPTLNPGIAAGYNVLLVTLDTVRQDRLGCYGDRRASTPNLDRVAAEGIRFDDAVTSAPLTRPSHATILTGLYPPNHGTRSNSMGYLPEDRLTLAETLQERGYETAAFIGCFVLDARFGMDQGFALYDFTVSDRGYRPDMVDYNERPADQVTDAAIRWLQQRSRDGESRPFFAWVHYFDAHLPFRSPLANDPRFTGRPYDAEIAFVDQQFGRLLGALEAEGARGRTLVVVASDHGEGLGDHGEQSHGLLLYETTVRVPLLFSCPAWTKVHGQVRHELVGLVDVRPSIEALLGLPVTLPCDGRSLWPGDPGKDRHIYLEATEPREVGGWSPLWGLRAGGAKYVEGPVRRFFDLQKDPRETVNLYNSNPPRLAGLVRELQEMLRSWEDVTEGSRVMTDEEIERLSSLGYVQASDPTPASTMLDPETMLPVMYRSNEAEQLYLRGRLAEAESVAREVLARWPESRQALRVLAFCQLKSGRSAEAVALLRRSVQRDRNVYGNVYLLRALAQALILSGDYVQAEEVLATYGSVAPDDGRVDLLRGDCLARRNLLEQALASYQRAATLDSNRVGVEARQRIAEVSQMRQGSRIGSGR